MATKKKAGKSRTYAAAMKRASAALKKKNKNGKSGTLKQVHALAKKYYSPKKSSTKKGGTKKGGKSKAKKAGSKKKSGMKWQTALKRASNEFKKAGKKASLKMVQARARKIQAGE